MGDLDLQIGKKIILLLNKIDVKPGTFSSKAKIDSSHFSRLIKGKSRWNTGIMEKVVEGFRLYGHSFKLFELLKEDFYDETQADTKLKGYTPREIQLLEDSVAANKEINEYLKKENKELKRKVEKLENEVQVLKKTWLSGRRLEDPPDLDVLSLRKDNYR